MALIGTLIITCRAIFFLVILVTGMFTKPVSEQRSVTGRLTCGIPILLTSFLLLKGISNYNPKADDLRREP